MNLRAMSLSGARTPIAILSREPVARKGVKADPFISRVQIGNRQLVLFEKRYPLNVDENGRMRFLREHPRELARRSLEVYSRLKKAGVRVPATYRWVEHPDGRCSLLQTDLSYGGKRVVASMTHAYWDEIPRISNLREVVSQIKADIRTAAKQNLLLKSDEWMLSIDPNTGHAEVHAADFDSTYVDHWMASPSNVRVYASMPSSLAGKLKRIDGWAADLRRAYRDREEDAR